MSTGENFELELPPRALVALVNVHIRECNVNCSHDPEKRKKEENFKDDLTLNFNVVLSRMDVHQQILCYLQCLSTNAVPFQDCVTVTQVSVALRYGSHLSRLLFSILPIFNHPCSVPFWFHLTSFQFAS